MRAVRQNHTRPQPPCCAVLCPAVPCRAVLCRAHLMREPPMVTSSPSCWLATRAWLNSDTGPDTGGAALNQQSKCGSYTSNGVDAGTWGTTVNPRSVMQVITRSYVADIQMQQTLKEYLCIHSHVCWCYIRATNQGPQPPPPPSHVAQGPLLLPPGGSFPPAGRVCPVLLPVHCHRPSGACERGAWPHDAHPGWRHAGTQRCRGRPGCCRSCWGHRNTGPLLRGGGGGRSRCIVLQ